MLNMKVQVLTLSASLIILAGCAQQKPPEPRKPAGQLISAKEDDHDHDHGPGPHGGTVIEFGKWHGEFCMDHGKKQATVYILDGSVKKAVPVATDKLLLSIKTPQFQVEMKADPQEGDPKGKSSRFVAIHDNFAKEQDFEGTVSGTIDGKNYAGDFKEEDHAHDKDAKK